jgi:hypothetical protein
MKHLLIVGGPATGKTRLAELEARKGGGLVSHTFWDKMMADWREFELGKVLASNPTTVIVEGFRPGRGRGNIEFIKMLAGATELRVPCKGGGFTNVPAPRWIFVAQTPLSLVVKGLMSEWSQSVWSRFEVVDLDQPQQEQS